MSNQASITNLRRAGERGDFLSLYKQYVLGNTEAPILFHIWSAICGVAATLGKNIFFTRGHFKIYPNLYVMLIGSPGTGKGTSINILQNLLLESGYRTFAADKSSKEKFLIDFQEGFSFSEEGESFEDARSIFSIDDFLSGEALNGTKEVFILAEEFNDFIGTNNTDFISLLTKLWSYEGVYRSRLKNSKSISISEPCINILGGNTSAGFAMAFPPEIIGQGFLARLLPIYGEPSGRKISFPVSPSQGQRSELVGKFRDIRSLKGEATISEEGRILLDKINQSFKGLPDGRFEYYGARRFNQLIKLCMVVAAFRTSTEITTEDIRCANTILSHTEELMPKAIGEFGKARNADTTSKIMEMLYTASKPLSTQDLWKATSNDLNSISDLANILSGLSHAEKIQSVTAKDGKHHGWLPRHLVKEQRTDLINEEMKKGLQDEN